MSKSRYDDMNFLKDWEGNLERTSKFLEAANNNYQTVIPLASTMFESVKSFKADLDRVKYGDDGIGSAFSDTLVLTEKLSKQIGTRIDEGLNAELTSLINNYMLSVHVVTEMIIRVSQLEGDENQKTVLDAMNSGCDLDSLFDITSLKNDLLFGIDLSELNIREGATGAEIIFAYLWKGKEELLNDFFEGVDGITPEMIGSSLFDGTLLIDGAWKKLGITATRKMAERALDGLKNYGDKVLEKGVANSITDHIAKYFAEHKVAIGVSGLLISYAANIAIEVLANGKELKDAETWIDAGVTLGITEISSMLTSFIVKAIAGEAFVAGSTGGIVTGIVSFALAYAGTALYDKFKEWYYSNPDGVSAKYESYSNKELELAYENMGYEFAAPTYSDGTKVGGKISAYNVAAEMTNDGVPEEIVDFVLLNAGVPIKNESEYYFTSDSGEVVMTAKGDAITDILASLRSGTVVQKLDNSMYEDSPELKEYVEEYNKVIDDYAEELRAIFSDFDNPNYFDYLSVSDNISDHSKIGRYKSSN